MARMTVLEPSIGIAPEPAPGTLPAEPAAAASARVTARGRFLHAGGEKLLLKGVT